LKLKLRKLEIRFLHEHDSFEHNFAKVIEKLNFSWWVAKRYQLKTFGWFLSSSRLNGEFILQVLRNIRNWRTDFPFCLKYLPNFTWNFEMKKVMEEF